MSNIELTIKIFGNLDGPRVRIYRTKNCYIIHRSDSGKGDSGGAFPIPGGINLQTLCLALGSAEIIYYCMFHHSVDDNKRLLDFYNWLTRMKNHTDTEKIIDHISLNIHMFDIYQYHH